MRDDTVLAKVPLTVDIARAIVIGISGIMLGYNKSFSWWMYDAKPGYLYGYGDVTVTLVQRSSHDDATQLVWRVQCDADEWSTPRKVDKFYAVGGEFPSCGGGEWDMETFREVRPQEKVCVEYV